MAAVMLVAVMFASCAGSNSPSGVVKSFYSSMKSGNVEKAVGYLNVDEERAAQLVTKYQQMLERGNATAELFRKGDVSILSEDVNGEEADVEVSVEIEGVAIQQSHHLTSVDGEWKIEE